jgi:hypothetical protein
LASLSYSTPLPSFSEDALLQPTRNGGFWMEHRAVSAASLGKYKENLPLEDIKHIEDELQPIFTHFSWEFDYPVPLVKQVYRVYKNRARRDETLNQQVAATAALLKSVQW